VTDIYKHIDNMFKDIVKTKETKKLKEQMRTGAKEKYEILILEGINEPDAIIKVINEIGTAEDLKAEYPIRNNALNIVAYIFTLLLVISLPSVIFILENKNNFAAHGNISYVYLANFALKPFNYMAVSFVALRILNRVSSKAKLLVIKNEVIRIAVLVICTVVTAVYFFNAAAIFFNLYAIPRLLYILTWFLLENSYVFALFGVLIFYGIKSKGDVKEGVS